MCCVAKVRGPLCWANPDLTIFLLLPGLQQAKRNLKTEGRSSEGPPEPPLGHGWVTETRAKRRNQGSRAKKSQTSSATLHKYITLWVCTRAVGVPSYGWIAGSAMNPTEQPMQHWSSTLEGQHTWLHDTSCLCTCLYVQLNAPQCGLEENRAECAHVRSQTTNHKKLKCKGKIQEDSWPTAAEY